MLFNFRGKLFVIYFLSELVVLFCGVNQILFQQNSILLICIITGCMLLVGALGMKFGSPGSDCWLTRPFEHDSLNFMNYGLQIILWPTILSFSVNKNLNVVPIYVTMVITLVLVIAIAITWAFKFSANKVLLYFQLFSVILLTGGFAKGIPTEYMYIFSKSNNKETLFIVSVIIAIIMCSVMSIRLMYENHVRLFTRDSIICRISIKYWILIGICVLGMVFLDSGFWLHPASSWHLTTNGLLLGVYAGIVEELVGRGLIFGVWCYCNFIEIKIKGF